jgi:hypothetical protein
MTILTRHRETRCGERRSLRPRPSLVVLVLMALGLAALFAPAAMAQPRGTASDPLALLAAQRATLTASDGTAADYFGYSIALSGGTALVGASHKLIGENEGQGAAYVFVRSHGVWSQQGGALTAGDGAANDYFGMSVALSGDTALVGASGANEARGAAYVFVRSHGVWSRQGGTLTASDGAADDWFGRSVALSGDTALIAAPQRRIGEDEAPGGAYVFVRSHGVWTQQGGALTVSEVADYEYFGYSVALSGDTALIGAPQKKVGANYVQGAAYVFVRSHGVWSRQGGALTASDGAAGDAFGYSVALSGGTALVGAPTGQYAAEAGKGAAYVFVRSRGVWSRQGGALTAVNGVAGESFGRAVALFGDTALVGAPRKNRSQGAAYMFVRSQGAWSQQGDALTASDGAAVDWFGQTVALSGDATMVGAPFKEIGANTDQGAVYVFAPETKPGLTTPVPPKSALRGVRFVVSGRLTPQFRAGEKTVTLTAFRYTRHAWRLFKTFAAVNADSGSSTRYHATIRLTQAGCYRFRASTVTTAAWLAARSGISRTLTVK